MRVAADNSVEMKSALARWDTVGTTDKPSLAGNSN